MVARRALYDEAHESITRLHLHRRDSEREEKKLFFYTMSTNVFFFHFFKRKKKKKMNEVFFEDGRWRGKKILRHRDRVGVWKREKDYEHMYT